MMAALSEWRPLPSADGAKSYAASLAVGDPHGCRLVVDGLDHPDRQGALQRRGTPWAGRTTFGGWREGDLRGDRPRGVALQHPDHGLPDALEVRAERYEHLGCDPFALSDEAEEDVFGPDIGV